jgi:hypothetical protein
MKILKHLQLTKKYKIQNISYINFELIINKYLIFLNICFHMNFLAKQIKSIIFIVIDFIRITLNTKHIIYMNIKYLKY